MLNEVAAMKKEFHICQDNECSWSIYVDRVDLEDYFDRIAWI